MTPKSDMSKIFRNAVLDLARRHDFARPFVNSGRLSVPCVYDGLPHFGEDSLQGPAGTRPGAACTDAIVGQSYLLDQLSDGFTLLTIGGPASPVLVGAGVPVATLHIETPSETLRARYLGDAPQAVYLIRPDHHVVARWASFDTDKLRAALALALGKD